MYARLFLALMLFAPLVGCSSEGVTSYTAPSDADPGTGPVRLLAAIVPVGKDTWVVKLTGRNDIVEKAEPGFRTLIGSLEFPAGGEVSMKWKVPEGWTEDRSKARNKMDRVATLTPKDTDKPEITITKLGKSAATVKPNVDRWRSLDLGLYAITPRALERVVSEQKVAGRTITIVDMRGPGGKGMSAAPMHDPRERRGKRPAGKAPFKYKVPEGWKETANAAGMTVATLSVTEGGETALLKVTPLSKSMPGGLKANVDRWRGDVGLPRLNEGEVEKLKFSTLRVSGIEAKMIDLQGTDKRSLVVWFDRGESMWFFKFLGPTKIVGTQKAKFEEFMKSVQFTGGAE